MTERIREAQMAVVQARETLINTARELQLRLQPSTLVREAWESAKNKGADLAEEAVDAVKRRPVATGGIIAAIALFLAREPIRDGVSRIYDAMTPDDEDAPPKPPMRRPVAGNKRNAPRKPRKTETKR